MDDQRFDRLARALVGPGSRRRALRLLVGGLAGGLLPRLGGEDAAARACAEAGERCDERLRCCPGGVCGDGRCVCRAGFTDRCDGRCRDLQTDDQHCGGCDNRCPAVGHECRGGRCVCRTGLTDRCDGRCRELLTDEAHCGECGNRCPPGERCCGGGCVDLEFSDAHCGRCGQACPAGLTCCGGLCLDLSSDPEHCGSCFNSCAAGNGICRDGECHCKPPFRCGAPSNRCARRPGAGCDRDVECCSGRCLDTTGTCAPCRGMACGIDEDCCDGFKCQETSDGELQCGGCIAAPWDRSCNPDQADCCFADCTEEPDKPGEFTCYSAKGGRCARDIDCRSCRSDSASCAGACVAGRCTR